jgi:hypothetical protein
MIEAKGQPLLETSPHELAIGSANFQFIGVGDVARFDCSIGEAFFK